MEGVTIGAGAVIGARTVVTQHIPPYAIVVGTPGRIVHYRHPPNIIAGLLDSCWWELSRDYLSQAPMDKPAEFLSYLKSNPPKTRAIYAGWEITRNHISPQAPNVAIKA